MTLAGGMLLATGMAGASAVWPSAQESAGATRAANGQEDIRELMSGAPIERELKGGEAHSYRLTLATDQFLHATVDQRGIDVVVKLFGPDGQPIAEVNGPTGRQGAESLVAVAEVSGLYRLEVRSPEEATVHGRYQAKIEALRDATQPDRDRVAAARLYEEALRLQAQGTAQSRRQAIEKFQAALPFYRAAGDRHGEASALSNIGSVYYFLSEPQTALEYLEQALSLRRTINDPGEADTLNTIGAIYDALGQLPKALEYFNQALPLRRTAGDRHGEASTLNNIGFIYGSLGDMRTALEYYNQALPLRRAVGDREGEAVTLNNIGAVYQVLGDLPKALDYLHQSLPLQRAIGDLLGQATTLSNIGAFYALLSDYQRALEYLNQALPLRRTVGDRKGEASTLHNMGRIYQSLGDAPKALEYHNQALLLRRAIGDRLGEANSLDSIGLAHRSLGDYQKALEYHNQVLALRRAIKDRHGEALTLSAIGATYNLLGEDQKALDSLNQALPLHRAVGDRQGESMTLFNIGLSFAAVGEDQTALEHYQQALSLSRAIGDQAGEASLLANIARAERRRGNLLEARAQMESALGILESVRGKVVSPNLRTSYLASKRQYYETYTDLLMQLNQREPTKGLDAVALQASERGRARSLLDLLSEARADIRQGVDPALVERERSLQQQLNTKADRLTQRLSGKHTEEQKAVAEKEVSDLLTQYQDVQAQIRATSPRYAALTQPQPLNLKEIQQQVLDDDTILLEYALGEDRGFLWAVTPTSITSFELPKRADIEATARRVYDLLIAQPSLQYPPEVAAFSHLLLGPVAEQLGKKRLLIVADGALQYVPFAALPAPDIGHWSLVIGQEQKTKDQGLRTKDQRPLIVDHEIVSLPSASVLAVLRRELVGRSPAPDVVAVLADPVFQPDDPRVKTQDLRPKTQDLSPNPQSAVERSARESGLADFRRLRYTRREAEAITAFAPVKGNLKALDFTASKAMALGGKLSRYRVVHFATHGLLNSTHPELSGIVLSLVNERGQPQDGFLRAHEVYNLNLPAELVVLSGCKTGLGKEIRGEGLVGLTRGFMYAGAPRVVVSVWNVSDAGTWELMRRFYQRLLKDGMRPTAALREAQVSMWQEKRWQAPYYWAGFVFQGEWR